MAQDTKDNVFFVVDGPDIAASAALLATSIYDHNKDGVTQIAYVPNARWDTLPTSLRDVLDLCGVRIEKLPDAPVQWRRPFPHGNKILAAAQPRKGSYGLFLDSDMICIRPMDLCAIKDISTVAMVPENTPNWSLNQDRWKAVYGTFDIPLPTSTVRSVRDEKVDMLPYFNAGFVFFPEQAIKSGKTFGQLWMDTAYTIDNESPVGGKRPWLDQISLPVTIARYDMNYNAISDDYNFSINRRVYDSARVPCVLHYLRWRWIKEWPPALKQFYRMEPILGHELYRRLMSDYEAQYCQIGVPLFQ
ncbi:hypothetical protein N9491_03615 [Planktomarina temperata]|nr:hypothetical protein [Planktomarina temperata]